MRKLYSSELGFQFVSGILITALVKNLFKNRKKKITFDDYLSIFPDPKTWSQKISTIPEQYIVK